MSWFADADKHREAERRVIAAHMAAPDPAAELHDEREFLRILAAFERDPSLRESIRLLMDRLDDRMSVLRLERMMGPLADIARRSSC